MGESGGGLIVSSCHALTSLDGLDSITNVSRLDLEDNPALENIESLSALHSIPIRR